MAIDLIQYIAANYAVDTVSNVMPVNAGFLSQNWIVNTTTARYFLKKYRFSQQERIAGIHAAKFFFATAGVPVILPMASHTGATFFTFEDKFYSLFPFVDGRHLQRGRFSPRAIKATARMLAQIHQAGKAAPLAGQRNLATERPDAQFVQSAEQILRLIPRQGRSAFDELAEQGLQLKLRLVQQFNNPGPMLDRNDDHLIHGDYQDGNLFFTEDEGVKAVFDWEKCSIAPRELELVRTIEFICFSNPHDYHAVFSAANYERARIFLSHYHAVYTVPRERFTAAVRARYLTQMHSLWVEAEHYLASNWRVDLFLETGLRTLQFYAEHLDQHIEELCKGILP